MPAEVYVAQLTGAIYQAIVLPIISSFWSIIVASILLVLGFVIGKVVGAAIKELLILKGRYPKASILRNQNVVFDICRNKYRLWVKVSYKNEIVLIEKIGTHKEYEKWNII